MHKNGGWPIVVTGTDKIILNLNFPFYISGFFPSPIYGESSMRRR